MAAKKGKPSQFRIELARGALVLAAASGLGLAVNAVSSRSLALWGGAATSENQDKVSAATRITADELSALLKRNEPVLVVDVRDQDAFEKGHVPASLHASIDAIRGGEQGVAAALEGASKSGALIVTLCDGEQCGKAGEAAEALRKLGYPNVRVLLGGWDAYARSGAQVETGPPR